ncbi:MAG: CopG family transcriptional regulator [Nitrospirae bacterium RBG_13_41_22]|nr:MAG: CopG family transcriptional regulator [Nitrospirae bacterium RBG_13_41_22]OHE60773.1 MAG: CopG family transcriptional regulator [Thermodesulfovibrio sp. RBG_19FT_COMBO_42_12]
MERQNVTLSLPKALLRKAKMIAAKREKSLSELLRESLEEKVRQETGYKEAMERQIRLMKKGFDLGTKGQITISRDELHERR